MDPVQDGGTAGSNRDRLILIVGLVTYGIGQSLLYVIFGPLARDTGLTETQFGVLISASNLALIFSSPRWGKASDRLGRRTVFVIGLIGFAVGYAGLAFGVQAGLWGWLVSTPLFLALLAVRLIYGVFAGGVNPAAAAYIADTTDEASRAKGMALVAAAGGIGSVLGPAIGGVLALAGPVFPMYAAAGFALLAAVWARASLVEPARHSAPPAGPVLKFTDRRIFPYLYGWFIIFLVFTGVQVITAFFVEDRIGVADKDQIIVVTSLALFTMGVVSVVMQVGVMQALTLQPRTLLRTALICFGGSLWVLALADTTWALYGAYALMGVTASLSMPSLSAAASLSVEPHEQGVAAGLLTAAPTVGMIFGPALGAWLYQLDTLLPLQLGGVAMILSGVYFWFVDIPDAQPNSSVAPT